MEPRACILDHGAVRVARIVEGRPAFQMEAKRAPNYLYLSNQAVVFLLAGVGMHGHEVDDFAYAASGQETRDQHIRVRPIKLLMRNVAGARGDSKKSSLLRIQDRAEHAGGIESRKTEPIDRAVFPDKRGSAKISNDSVILNGLVGHDSPIDWRQNSNLLLHFAGRVVNLPTK